MKEGKIKRTVKFIEKANDKKLQEVYKEYKANQFEEVNQRITEDLINQFSNFMSSLKLVDDNELLKEDLRKFDLMKEDIKNIVGTITPYLPYVGLLCGGVCVAKHIWNKKTTTQEPKETNNNGEDNNNTNDLRKKNFHF